MKARILLVFVLFLSFSIPNYSHAEEDFSCLNFKIANKEGTWSIFEGPTTTKAIATWSIIDPGNCITKSEKKGIARWVAASSSVTGEWNGTFSNARDGQNYVIYYEVDIPNSWISAMGNSKGTYTVGMVFNPLVAFARIHVSQLIERKVSSKQYTNELLDATLMVGELWSKIISQRQGLTRANCIPASSTDYNFDPQISTNYRIVSNGKNPKVVLELSESSNCISSLYTPLLDKETSYESVNCSWWDEKMTKNWPEISVGPFKYLRASSETFGSKKKPEWNFLTNNKWSKSSLTGCGSSLDGGFVVTGTPKLINTDDSVQLIDEKIEITSNLDLSSIETSQVTEMSKVQIVIGAYFRFNKESSCYPGSWSVTAPTPSFVKLTYSKGGCTTGGLTESRNVVSIEIPTLDLLERNGVANAKAAAELRAATELKASQDKAAADRKARQEAAEKEAADLKIKQEAEAKAAAEKAAADKIIADANAKAAAAVKKSTITCVKGKLTKKVTAVKPVCPKGYKKK